MKNPYYIGKELVFIEVRRKNIWYETVINKIFLEEVKKNSWFLNHDGYVVTSGRKGNRKTTFLHHVILPKKVKLEIDHINRIKLDNRIENLIYVTRQQNVCNTNIRKDSRNSEKGVQKHNDKFLARIQVNGKRKYLGIFNTEKEASIAYKNAVHKYHQMAT